MNFTQRIGTCAAVAVMAAAGWAHEAFAAGRASAQTERPGGGDHARSFIWAAFAAGPSPSSPSTAIAPQVLRDQSQRPADAIGRATDPVRSAPSGDKEPAPKASEPAQASPPAGPKPVPPGSK